MIASLLQGTVGTLAFGSITLVLWYGGKLVFEKKLTAGVLTSFLMYTLTVRLSVGPRRTVARVLPSSCTLIR